MYWIWTCQQVYFQNWLFQSVFKLQSIGKQSFSILHTTVIFIHYKQKALFWNDLDLNQNPVLKVNLMIVHVMTFNLHKNMQLTNRTPVYEYINKFNNTCNTPETFFYTLFLAHELDNIITKWLLPVSFDERQSRLRFHQHGKCLHVYVFWDVDWGRWGQWPDDL